MNGAGGQFILPELNGQSCEDEDGGAKLLSPAGHWLWKLKDVLYIL